MMSNLKSVFSGAMALLVLAVVAAAGSGAALAQGALNYSNTAIVSTQYTSNSANGISFDIVAGPTPIRIYRIGFAAASSTASQEVRLFRTDGGMSTVYPPTGTASFKPNAQWIHVGYEPAMANPGIDIVAQCPIDINVVIPANGRMGFKVVTSSVRYYNTGTTLATPHENGNADLSIYHYGAGGGTLPSPGSVEPWQNFPRVFSGTVWYDYDQIAGTHTSLNTIGVNNGGAMQLGNNTVSAEVKNQGTVALDNQTIAAEYSVDGGTTWSAPQNFSFPSFPPLGNQTLTFTTPANITAVGSVNLQVRLVAPTPIGQGDALKSRVYTPDADLSLVGGLGPNGALILGANTIQVEVTNNGSFSLDGVTLPIQYSRDNGTTWLPATPHPFVGGSALANTSSTQLFQFPGTETFSSGQATLMARIQPPLNGDPDISDEITSSQLVGVVTADILASAPSSSYTTTGLPFVPNGYTMTRTSALYLASELSAAGLNAGDPIVGMSLMTGSNATVFTAPITDFRIGIMHTTDAVQDINLAALPLNSAYTNVWGPGNLSQNDLPVSQYVDFTFHTAFTWNGVDNVRFDFQNDQATAATIGIRGVTMCTGLVTARITRSYSNGPHYPDQPGNCFGTAGIVPKIRLFTPVPANQDLDIDSVSFGPTQATAVAGPSVGNNSVHVTVKNAGLQAVTSNFGLSFSTDGGTTWSATQTVTPVGLAVRHDSMTVTLPQAWNIPAVGASQLHARIDPQIPGDPDPSDVEVLNFQPDADVIGVSGSGTNGELVAGVNTVSTTIQNNGTLGLNGAAIPLQFSIDGGTTWSSTETFTPTTLGSPSSTETYTFLAQTPPVGPGFKFLTVRISPVLSGDPDTVDQHSISALVGFLTVEINDTLPEVAMNTSGYPFNKYWHDQRYETVILASELAAAGIHSGAEIGAVWLKPSSLPAMNVDDFRVRMQHVTTSTHSGQWTTTGWTNVYGPSLHTVASIQVGVWYEMQFSSPFIWNGTDNIMFDFSTDGVTYAGLDPDGGIFVRTTTANRAIYSNADSTYVWPFDGMTPNAVQNVPSLRISYAAPQGTDLDIDAVTYGTAGSSGPQVGSNVVNVRVKNGGSSAIAGNFGVEYSLDNGATWVSQSFTASGLGSLNQTQTVSFTTPWTISALGPQQIRVRINPQVVGDPDTTDEVTLNYNVNATLVSVGAVGGVVNIGNNSITATVRNDGTMGLNGASLPMSYSIDGGTTWSATQNFTPTTLGGANSTETFTFATAANVPSSGPVTLMARISPVLTGDPSTADEISQLFLVGFIEAEVLSSAAESASPGGTAGVGYPFNDWYMCNRTESIYLASELLAAGLYPGAAIGSAFLKPSQVPAFGDYNNFRIRMRHTSASAAPIAYTLATEPGWTLVHGPTYLAANEIVVNQWIKFDFTAPFVWNGVDNLTIDFTNGHTLFPTTGSGGCFLRATPTARTRIGRADSVITSWPYDGTTLGAQANVNFVPSLKLLFEAPADPSFGVSRSGNAVQQNGTDNLGSTMVTATVAQNLTYTISNSGISLPLNITSVTIPPASVTNCTATITTNPQGTPIPASQTGTLVISLNAAAGPFSFDVNILSNSNRPGQDNFTFTVSGDGFVNTTPTVNVLSGGTASAVISKIVLDDTNGSYEYFEITNVGASPVDLTGWTCLLFDDNTTPYSGFPLSLSPIGMLAPGVPYVVGEDLGPYGPNALATTANWSWYGSFGAVVLIDGQSQVRDAVYFGAGPGPGSLTPAIPATEWLGAGAPMVTTAQKQLSRVGIMDSNDASDWVLDTNPSLGVLNPGLMLPFGGGGLQVSGVYPNFLLETVSGEDLTSIFLAEDIDGHQQVTITVTEGTGGTITAAQAGFTNTFPFTAGPGAPGTAAVMLGTAAAAGTVVFNVNVSDNGVIPLNDTVTITYRIGARVDLTNMVSDSLFVRVSGVKDFYRGQTGRAINMLMDNPNPFAVEVQSVTLLPFEAGTQNLLTGFTFTLPGAPITVPANATGFALAASMDIDANASGGNGVSVELVADNVTAIDPVAPVANPIIVKVLAAADEFDLYDGPVPQPMAITTTSFAPAVENVPFLQDLLVTGGLGTFTWSIPTTSVSTLPQGLTLNPNGNQFLPASIQGTPAAGTAVAGPYTITLEVTDGAYVDDVTLVLTVNQLLPLALAPITMPQGQEFITYPGVTLQASGGSLIYTYGVDLSSVDPLPAGLSLDPQSGVVSGTPADQSQGTFTITFEVSDGIGSQTQTTQLVIIPHPLAFRTTTIAGGEETVAYSEFLDGIGGTAPRIYTIAPPPAAQLPAGLSLNGTTGEISGTPAVNSAGTYNVSFTITDGLNATVTQTIAVVISVPPPLTITTNQLSYAQVGQSLSQTIMASGGSRQYTFSVGTGTLAVPNSVVLSNAGELSADPMFGDEGRFPLSIIVNDGYTTVSKTLDLTVLAYGANMVKITEVDVGSGYIEFTNLDANAPVDISAWKVVTWVDGVTPLAMAFDTFGGGTTMLPADVVTLSMGGTAGGTWPNFNSGTPWTATSTSNIAVALMDFYGNVVDFVHIGSVNTAGLQDASANPAEIPEFMATMPAVTNGAANYSYGTAGWMGSAAGSLSAFNPGLPAVTLEIANENPKVAIIGEAYSHMFFPIGGTAPYTWSLSAPNHSWLSINPNTGELTGTAAGSAGASLITVTLTDANQQTAVINEGLAMATATASPTAGTIAIGTGTGQSFEGTVIIVPVTMTPAAGVTDVSGFNFEVVVPQATSSWLTLRRVIAGPATTAAGLSVISRSLGNGRYFVGEIDGPSQSSAISAGEIVHLEFIVPFGNGTAPVGMYDVSIANAEVHRSTIGVFTSAGTNGGMDLSNFAVADVNRDGNVNVVDVQLTVNIILSTFAPTYQGQGDVNGSGTVNVVDVQVIVNCILNASSCP